MPCSSLYALLYLLRLPEMFFVHMNRSAISIWAVFLKNMLLSVHLLQPIPVGWHQKYCQGEATLFLQMFIRLASFCGSSSHGAFLGMIWAHGRCVTQRSKSLLRWSPGLALLVHKRRQMAGGFEFLSPRIIGVHSMMGSLQNSRFSTWFVSLQWWLAAVIPLVRSTASCWCS